MTPKPGEWWHVRTPEGDERMALYRGELGGDYAGRRWEYDGKTCPPPGAQPTPVCRVPRLSELEELGEALSGPFLGYADTAKDVAENGLNALGWDKPTVTASRRRT